MGMAAAQVMIEAPSALRAELAEGIKAAWHKGREYYLKLGRLLIEAKDKLGHGNFTQMVLEDMPFSPRQAQSFMEIARSPRIGNPKNSSLLPVAVETLKAIDKLSDGEYEAALSHGVIRPDVTEREVRDFQRQITRPETVETGEAWNEIAKKLHRPQAIAKHAAPVAPKGAGATTLAELMYLLIQRRHALGHSQAAMDDIVGWAEGLCSKYEILHRDEGRAPSIDAILDYAQGLKCGIQLVAL